MQKRLCDVTRSKFFFKILVLFNAIIDIFYEGYLLDRIKMTESRWPKSVNMTEKLTTTYINMVNMTENIINITTTMNILSEEKISECSRFVNKDVMQSWFNKTDNL